MTFITRQVAGQTAAAPITSAHYDHRWLLFIIPICLLFIALVFTVWYVLRRRRKQKQRRSILRNRALVVADEEKQRERDEKRLSRANSLSSRLSRMTSMKSSTTRSFKTRSSEVPSRSTSGHGHAITRGHNHADNEKMEAMDDKKDTDADLEHIAESIITLPVVAASPESNNKVRIVEEAMPIRVKRKQANDPGQDISNSDMHRSGSGIVHRQDSHRSVRGVNNSVSQSIEGSRSNAFTSPSTSSAGHEMLTSQMADSNSNVRQMSGIARLRQPSPIASSRNVQRSESRSSRKSSTRSTRRGDSQPPLSASAASIAAANWTYTSQADKWKPSSTDVSAPSRSSAEGAREIPTGDTTLSLFVGQLARKPSTGVAGSRFVESFD